MGRLGAAAALLVVLGGAAARLHSSNRVAAAAPEPERPLPRSALAVERDGTWRTWWRSDRAPARWDAADAELAGALTWHAAGRGLEWGEATLAGSGEAWRTRLLVARFDPRRFHARLDTAFARDGAAAWRLDRAPAGAALAVNAGQFVHTMPWGWVVLDGHRFLSRGAGPLATVVVIDSGGAFHWLHGDAAVPAGVPVAFAFQSYPTLLHDGAVPEMLRHTGDFIDLGHRDARLAMGALPDGRVIIAMTRFDALGPGLGFVPFGLTTPEMAAVMGALGARDAVMLDGGISAQLLVRDVANGTSHAWRGLRDVPLAMVLTPR